MNDNDLKNLYLALCLIMLPGLIGSALKTCSAFHRQAILKEPYGIQLRVTPDMFVPCEGIDRAREYCGLNKHRAPQLPETITV